MTKRACPHGLIRMHYWKNSRLPKPKYEGYPINPSASSWKCERKASLIGNVIIRDRTEIEENVKGE